MREFLFRSRVAHHEVGAFGDVRPSGVARLMQEAAIEASTDAGHSAEWYVQAGTQWIVRRTSVELHDALRGGEAVTVRTWVADFRRVLSRREYEVRAGDGRAVARGWSDWVYVDVVRERPKRVEPEMIAAFLPGGPAAPVERIPLEIEEPPPDAFRHRQVVLLRDLDGFAHMNNAATIDLLEETFAAALGRAGRPLGALLEAGIRPRLRGFDVEYLDEARHGEALEARFWGARNEDELASSFEVVAADRENAPLTHGRARWIGLAPLENSLRRI